MYQSRLNDHFDRMLLRVRWRRKAQGCDNQGVILRIKGFPAMSVISSSVCIQGKIRSCSKDDPFQINVSSLAIKHFDRTLELLRWRGKAQVGEISVFTDQWIHGDFG